MEVHARKSGKLELVGTPVKRLLDVEGLGVRHLKRLADGLLILSGPTEGL